MAVEGGMSRKVEIELRVCTYVWPGVLENIMTLAALLENRVCQGLEASAKVANDFGAGLRSRATNIEGEAMNSIVTARPAPLVAEYLGRMRPVPGRMQSGLRDDERSTLHAGPWFSELSHGLRDAILGSARVREVAPGEMLARRGDTGAAWIGVASGALRLGTALRDGREFTLDFVGPGQWFGDIALIDDRPLELDVAAHVRSKLLFVSKADLQRLVANFGELGPALLRLNCQRLRHMYRRFEELQMLPLSQRLARQLQRLAHQFGRASAEGVQIDLALSQADLASIVGGSRQRVNRALRQMHCLGIVRISQSHLSILAGGRLEAVAQGQLLLSDAASEAANDVANETVSDIANDIANAASREAAASIT
jgi:CRP-like cAMP-binding protein